MEGSHTNIGMMIVSYVMYGLGLFFAWIFQHINFSALYMSHENMEFIDFMINQTSRIVSISCAIIGLIITIKLKKKKK